MTNVHKPLAERTFRDEFRRTAHKTAIAENYSWHMGYVNKGDRTANYFQLVREHGSGQRNYFSPVGSNNIE
jgi:hypothetical protein